VVWDSRLIRSRSWNRGSWRIVESDGMAIDFRREAVPMIAWSRLHPDILADR